MSYFLPPIKDLTTTGSIGIGKATPSYPLDIVSGSAQFPIAINIDNSTHATSRRAAINVGGWALLTDINGDGTKNFSIYDSNTSATRLFISTTGNVGIGGTTPGVQLSTRGRISVFDASVVGEDLSYNGALVVTRDAASGQHINLVRSGNWSWSIGTVYNTNTFAIGNSSLTDSAFSSLLSITTGGNVGIGIDSAVKKLHVVDTADNYQIRLGGTSVYNYDIGRNNPDGLLYFYGNQTGYNGYVFTGVDGERMRITSSGNVGIGISSPPQLLAVGNSTDQVGAGISGAVSTLYFGSPSNASGGIKRIAYDRASGALSFIGGSVASPSTQMILDNSGNVGIGTTSPSNKLHVEASGGSAIFRLKNSSSTSDTYYISDSNGTSIIQTGPLPVILSTSSNERMRIDSSGNVGIGESDPKTKLDVAGTIKTSGGVQFIDNTIQKSAFVSVFNYMTAAQIQYVSSYGASGTSSDLTSAISSALAAEAYLYFPPGRYRMDGAPSTVANKHTNVEGAGPELTQIYYGATTGSPFSFSHSTSAGSGCVWQTIVRNLSIVANGVACSYPAISIAYSGSYGGTDLHNAGVIVENVTVRGATLGNPTIDGYSDYFAYGLNLDNCLNATINRYYYEGLGSSGTGYAIQLNNQWCKYVTITNCKVVWGHSLVYCNTSGLGLNQFMEGIRLDKCSVVATDYLFYHGGNNSGPLIVITNSDAETRKESILIGSATDVKIYGCELFKRTTPSTGEPYPIDWTGIYLGSCHKSSVFSNNIYAGANATINNTTAKAIVMDNCIMGAVYDNSIYGDNPNDFAICMNFTNTGNGVYYGNRYHNVTPGQEFVNTAGWTAGTNYAL